jgi:hypothetical protein
MGCGENEVPTPGSHGRKRKTSELGVLDLPIVANSDTIPQHYAPKTMHETHTKPLNDVENRSDKRMNVGFPTGNP